ncbi:MAG: DNA helicase-2/ATP-dependent DNA helicase PcrA [Myxococcota bacterium]
MDRFYLASERAKHVVKLQHGVLDECDLHLERLDSAGISGRHQPSLCGGANQLPSAFRPCWSVRSRLEGKMRHPIVDEEEEHLGRVRILLEEEPYQAPPRESEIVAELLRLRDDVRDAKEEDKGAILAQYNAHYALLKQLRVSRDREEVDPDSPYFAHLKLEEDGRTRDIFLGKATRIQRGVRIVDWRNAPISRLFYRYQQGDEYEEEMGGRVRVGEVAARRTITILRGKLLRVDAPEGSFQRHDDGWIQERLAPPRLAGGQGSTAHVYSPGDGNARRLGTDLGGRRRRADKRLPDIAGLIDEDQFSLITRPSSGFVVVRGTAGSGKTTVALHRIAWLAYNDPRIDSPATLFVVFSRALRDYVSHVLPALGIHGVSVRDYHSWAKSQVQRHFPMLPRAIREATPAVVVRLKLHPACMSALEEQVAQVTGPPTSDQAIDDWLSVLSHLDRIEPHIRRIDPDAFTTDELRRATEWCRDRAEEVVAWVEGDREEKAELDVEDAPLLLRAWQLRVGPLRGKGKRPLRYRHVAVDEVQDFSPLEVRVLLDTLDERQSITLAGDTQQHVMKEAGFTSWSGFFRHLGIEGTSVDTLRVAYRSSKQVVEFALALLGDLREDTEPPLVTRDGPQVEMFRFTDHGACVAFLADALKELMETEPLASVVLLCPDAAVSNTYLRGLEASDVPSVRQVTTQDFSFAPGIEITEVDQVKGLEFDYVVAVEASARHYPDHPMYRRLLHVAATRAVHQLWLTSVGAPSPIVRQALDPAL